jgi:hypothetical protein
MADDTKKKGMRDAARVSAQAHEIGYLARKTGRSKAEVREAKSGAKSDARKDVARRLAKPSR